MKPINQSKGTTPSERYLAGLCKQTFLSLWSFPNLFTSEGKKGDKGVGKELCDLLVVFGQDILIFSDKDVSYNTEADPIVAWNRWRKRAILNSANQLWGAEKWINEHSSEIFLDKYCLDPFPLEIDISLPLRIHLIAVTTNSVPPAKAFFGGGSSGSMMLFPMLSNDEITNHPFTLNDIDPNRTFVHVLDEMTLNILFHELDTTYDLIRYLTGKENAIRSHRLQLAAGEEEVLAYYMEMGGLVREDPFTIPERLQNQFQSISLPEGLWSEYLISDLRKEMKNANQVSYFWDALIESFAGHIRAGTVPISRDAGVSTHEKAIRFLAAEGRLARGVLSKQFLEKMRSTPADRRSSRSCPSPFNEKIVFILVLLPRAKDLDYEKYREERIGMLHAYAIVYKYQHPNVEYITLIGTEPKDSDGRSEDVIVFETPELSEHEKKLARRFIQDDQILSDISDIRANPPTYSYQQKANNQKPNGAKTKKIGRNDPCFCGSGQKFKHCCY